MVGLTTKQKEELNLAILEYLNKNKFKNAAEQFADEAGISPDDKNNSSQTTMKDILEKKWTSLVKLKKQVIELEKQNKQLKDSIICEKCGGGAGSEMGSNKSSVLNDGLPKQPEKFTLQGHKDRITKVAIHPIYS